MPRSMLSAPRYAPHSQAATATCTDKPSAAQPHALRAVEAHGPYVRALQLVLAHDGTLHLVEDFLVIGDLHAHDVRRVEQARRVVLQTKDARPLLGVIGPNTFKYAHAIVQGVGQNMDSRLPPGKQLPHPSKSRRRGRPSTWQALPEDLHLVNADCWARRSAFNRVASSDPIPLAPQH